MGIYYKTIFYNNINEKKKSNRIIKSNSYH